MDYGYLLPSPSLRLFSGSPFSPSIDVTLSYTVPHGGPSISSLRFLLSLLLLILVYSLYDCRLCRIFVLPLPLAFLILPYPSGCILCFPLPHIRT